MRSEKRSSDVKSRTLTFTILGGDLIARFDELELSSESLCMSRSRALCTSPPSKNGADKGDKVCGKEPELAA